MENFLSFERRQYPRLRINLPIRYRLKTKPVFNSNIAYDISESGIRFQSYEFLPNRYEIMIELPLFYAKSPVVTQAKIAWIKKEAYCLRFQIGCKFTQVQWSQEKDIVKFLRSKREYPTVLKYF